MGKEQQEKIEIHNSLSNLFWINNFHAIFFHPTIWFARESIRRGANEVDYGNNQDYNDEQEQDNVKDYSLMFTI